jgi:hypothetical protein
MKDRLDPEEAWKASLAKIKNPVARRFYEQGRAFIRQNGGAAYELEAGTEEHKAWAKYFAALGWAPTIFSEMQQAVKDGAKRSMTVPSQWPEWFEGQIAA